MLNFLITNCLLHFIFAGATPLFNYEFYGEGYARETDELTPFDGDYGDDSEGSGDVQAVVYLSKTKSKREVTVIDSETKVYPLVTPKPGNEVKNGTEHGVSDVECGNNTTTTKEDNCKLRKRPTIVLEVNEKHVKRISEETIKKIKEVQAEPVILTQGV